MDIKSKSDKLQELQGAIIAAVESGNAAEIDKLCAQIGIKDNFEEIPDCISLEDALNENWEMPEVLIEGLLHKGHSMMISAASKARKSWLLLNLAFCISSGTKFLDMFQCKKEKVLYLNFEIHRGLFLNRIKLAMPALGLDVKKDFFMMNLRGRYLTIEELVTKLRSMVIRFGVGVVILDPFYKICNSSVRPRLEENGNNDMAYILSIVSSLLKDDVSVITAHHFTKGKASSANSKDVIDRMSGAGTLARDPDCICTMTEKNTAEAPGVYCVEFVARNFAPPAPVDVIWQFPIHKATFDYGDVKKDTGKKPTITFEEIDQIWQEARDSKGVANLEVVCGLLNTSYSSIYRIATRATQLNKNIHNLKVSKKEITGTVLASDKVKVSNIFNNIPLDVQEDNND